MNIFFYKKNNAFSLVEAMISMFIILIIISATIPVMTRIQKKSTNTGVKGQFGCYRDSEGLKQWKIDEYYGNAADAKDNTCQLTFTRRPQHYFIVLVGSKKDKIMPEVITSYSSAVANNLRFTLGTDGGDTIMESLDPDTNEYKEVYRAHGSTTNLKASNINSCYIKSPLPDAKTSLTCQKIDDSIRINVQTKQTDGSYADDPEKRFSVKVSDLVALKDSSSILPEAVTRFYKISTDKFDDITIAIKYNNSDYMPNYTTIPSLLSQFLDSITDKRVTNLTTTIRGLYDDDNNSNAPGLVYVIW